MKRLHLHLILAAAAITLSLLSVAVVIQGASDEPYTVFRWSDAIVQIGVAMMLMLLWLQLGITTLFGVLRERVSGWWLPLLIWVVICEFYLFHCPSGYVYDINRYVAVSR